jgi:hypothetical protein
MDARDGRQFLIGMFAMIIAVSIGIKIGWDWGRGDFASRAAALRMSATLKAEQRNKRLQADLNAERARREALVEPEGAIDARILQRAERIAAEMIKTAPRPLTFEEIAAMNSVIKEAGR